MNFTLTPSQTLGPYFAIGLPWAEGPHAVAPGTPGAFTIRGTIYDGLGGSDPRSPDRDLAGRPGRALRRHARPRRPVGAPRLPRLRALRRRGRRRQLRDPDRQARPGAGPPRSAAGPAPGGDADGARDAQPRRHPDLLRRRGRGQRERPGARPRARRTPPDPARRSRTATAATASTSASRARARPCSSPSEEGGGLFASIYARGAVAAELDDRAWVRALLDVEAALARALGGSGRSPTGGAADRRRLSRAGPRGRGDAIAERSSASTRRP